MLWLAVGGFLVTASSNAINQIIEKDLDKLMTRTQNRPLPSGKMTELDASIAAGIMGVVGVVILFAAFNFTCGFLGAIALFLYTVIYTPLKRETPFAVFVGAFPGAIPPMLGALAGNPDLSRIEPWILFGIQFLWQFPHFWAIAWVLDEDYKKAGFKMLPTGMRDKGSAFQTLVYTVTLIPMSLLPVAFKMSGYFSAAIISLAGVIFAFQALKLYRLCDTKSAQQLMFGSFVYLPVVQLAILFDKL